MNRIIYHGTTDRRYRKIKLKGLRGNMKRTLTPDNAHFGFSFFTENRREAVGYALLTYYLDRFFNGYSYEETKDNIVVLGIRTLNYIGKFEKDPEYKTTRFTNQQIAQMFGDGQWWRTKVTIKPKDIKVIDTLNVWRQDPIIKNLWKQAAIAKLIQERYPEDAEKLKAMAKENDEAGIEKLVVEIFDKAKIV